MHSTRRQVMSGLAAATAASMMPAAASAAPAAAPQFDPMPPLPAKPSPGKPGDFAFLTGEWTIHHRQLNVAGEWIEYAGEATVHAILDGIGSVEELRIPARKFSGMGLRLLDVEKQLWSDFWVNSRSGVLTTPGQTGSFENGSGIFFSEDTDNGKAMIYAGVWDRISAQGCRWRQASSEDGGLTWKQNWIMDWTRVR